MPLKSIASTMEYKPDKLERSVAVGLVPESIHFVLLGAQSYVLSPLLPLKNFGHSQLVGMMHSVRLE